MQLTKLIVMYGWAYLMSISRCLSTSRWRMSSEIKEISADAMNLRCQRPNGKKKHKISSKFGSYRLVCIQSRQNPTWNVFYRQLTWWIGFRRAIQCKLHFFCVIRIATHSILCLLFFVSLFLCLSHRRFITHPEINKNMNEFIVESSWHSWWITISNIKWCESYASNLSVKKIASYNCVGADWLDVSATAWTNKFFVILIKTYKKWVMNVDFD